MLKSKTTKLCQFFMQAKVNRHLELTENGWECFFSDGLQVRCESVRLLCLTSRLLEVYLPLWEHRKWYDMKTSWRLHNSAAHWNKPVSHLEKTAWEFWFCFILETRVSSICCDKDRNWISIVKKKNSHLLIENQSRGWLGFIF